MALPSRKQRSECYTGTTIPIQKGDRISLDDTNGTVEMVCRAKTADAMDYSCFRTGGVLVMSDEGILILFRFGHFETIQRA